MSDPPGLPDLPGSAPQVFIDDDLKRLERQLRDDLPADSIRRLLNAILEAGVVVAYLETPIEESPEECQELHGFVKAALTPDRHPAKFACERWYPGSKDLSPDPA